MTGAASPEIPEPASRSVRRALLEQLRSGPATLPELARAHGLREREAAEHLAHALRSVAGAEKVVREPATCLACGFRFRERGRLTTPGRCPRCRAERIEPARLQLVTRGG